MSNICISVGGPSGNTVIRTGMGDFAGGSIIRDDSDGSIVVVVDSDLPALIKALQDVQAHVDQLNATEGDEA